MEKYSPLPIKISGRPNNINVEKAGVSSPLLVNSLLLLVLIYVGRVQEIIPRLSGFAIGKVAVVGVLILYLSSRERGVAARSVWSYPAGKYMVAIGLIATGSIPGSVWQGASFNFVFSYYFKVTLFVYLVAMIARSRDDLRRLCWGLAWSAVLLAAGAVISPDKIIGGRISSSWTYDSNDMALLLVMVLPVMYYMMFEAKGLGRYLLLAGMGLVLYVISMTGSRGGILALGAVILAILLKRGLKRAIQILPLVLLALYLVFSGSPHLERYLGISNLESDYNIDGRSGRIDVWKRTIPLIFENPLFGSGAAAFEVAEGATHEYGKWSSPHNSFIQIGVELGFVALCWHIFIIYSMIQQWRSNKTAMGDGLEVGLYAYCVGGFFLSWGYAYIFYLFIGFSIAAARMDDFHRQREAACLPV